MKNQIFLSAILISLLLLLLIAACIKEEEETNQFPTCFIAKPINGGEVVKGDTVTIFVEAVDADGSITEIRLLIDDILKDTSSQSTLSFYWSTISESFGIHTIKAISFDNYGDSTLCEISVTLVDNTPIAGFTASPTSGTAPLIVNFTDQSTNTPTNYQWDFGDGGISTQQNPSHTYNYGSTFTVALTVSNSYGSATATEDIIVVPNLGTFTDLRDEQTYNTIIIGNQTWFAENLNYETDASYCYQNNPTYCDIFGRLYSNQMALFACPNGWHLPSDEEWKILEVALGMSQSEADDTGLRGTDEGDKMKSTTGWNSNGNGTNVSGFNALAGGYRGSVGSSFYNRGNYGCWWSSTANTSTNIWGRSLSFDGNQVNRDYWNKAFGYSVRCVKD